MPTSSSPIIWRAEYPPAPRVKLVQSVATGIELIDLAALPPRVTVCNAFGHETAIAEYILMVMLVWSHRFQGNRGRLSHPLVVATQLGAERGAAWRDPGQHGRHRRARPGRLRGRAPRRRVRLPHHRRKPQRAGAGEGGRASLPAQRARPYACRVRLRRAVHRPRPGDRGADRRAPAGADEALGVSGQHRSRRGRRRGRDLCSAARPHHRRSGARRVVAVSGRKPIRNAARRVIRFTNCRTSS